MLNPNELTGYCSVSDLSNGSTYDVKLKGIFINKKFLKVSYGNFTGEYV